jgi:hypothetical protein
VLLGRGAVAERRLPQVHAGLIGHRAHGKPPVYRRLRCRSAIES